jgi:hypothetical protein
MDRRAFFGSVAALATMSRVAWAQPSRTVYRLGIVSLGATPNVSGPSARALLQGLKDLGYVYGSDFVTEPSYRQLRLGIGASASRTPLQNCHALYDR